MCISNKFLLKLHYLEAFVETKNWARVALSILTKHSSVQRFFYCFPEWKFTLTVGFKVKNNIKKIGQRRYKPNLKRISWDALTKVKLTGRNILNAKVIIFNKINISLIIHFCLGSHLSPFENIEQVVRILLKAVSVEDFQSWEQHSRLFVTLYGYYSQEDEGNL